MRSKMIFAALQETDVVIILHGDLAFLSLLAKLGGSFLSTFPARGLRIFACSHLNSWEIVSLFWQKSIVQPLGQQYGFTIAKNLAGW